MQVISVNVGRAETLQGSKTETDAYLTGIYKRPVQGAVAITTEGLAGDKICDSNYHGSPDQAVYLYGWTDYEWWQSLLGQPLSPGIFGENLTLSELDNARLQIGDRFRVGDSILEVTAPRIPCVTLSRRMQDSAFLKKFRSAERPGAYCRVIREGVVRADEAVVYEPFPANGVSMLEIFRAEFAPPKNAEILRAHLASPLASRIRIQKEKLLAKLEGETPP